jgi:hypothetical protein
MSVDHSLNETIYFQWLRLCFDSFFTFWKKIILLISQMTKSRHEEIFIWHWQISQLTSLYGATELWKYENQHAWSKNPEECGILAYRRCSVNVNSLLTLGQIIVLKASTIILWAYVSLSIKNEQAFQQGLVNVSVHCNKLLYHLMHTV